MKIGQIKFLYPIPWNVFLITLGSIICSIGVKAIVIPHGFITGGASGLGLLFVPIPRAGARGWYVQPLQGTERSRLRASRGNPASRHRDALKLASGSPGR